MTVRFSCSTYNLAWSDRRPFFTVFPLVQMLLRAASKDAAQPFNLGLLPLAENFPNIAQWVQRIEALPNYQRTYPPHWKQ
jgi:glutathione S-transferase